VFSPFAHIISTRQRLYPAHEHIVRYERSSKIDGHMPIINIIVFEILIEDFRCARRSRDPGNGQMKVANVRIGMIDFIPISTLSEHDFITVFEPYEYRYFPLPDDSEKISPLHHICACKTRTISLWAYLIVYETCLDPPSKKFINGIVHVTLQIQGIAGMVYQFVNSLSSQDVARECFYCAMCLGLNGV
jgi:hypothetical protein